MAKDGEGWRKQNGYCVTTGCYRQLKLAPTCTDAWLVLALFHT